MNIKMKAFVFFVLSALSLNALATNFNPSSTTFSAQGVLVIKPQSMPAFTCNMLLTGHTNNDDTATITSASFTGQALCKTVVASGLPWTWKATSTSNASLSGVKISAAGINCSSSPGTLTATWSNAANTLTTIPNQPLGSCVIQAFAVVPSPALIVVP
ncbi:hypothetical protein ACPA5B_22240 [Pseudomonas solani]|uniref:hypothetical protein n=1 Tax=Pseudomonas TaxID=286 RepID=UPI0021E0C0A9|nr:hypothetical protein [Pseudomonas sp. PDM13]MCU9949688.1 hypothetical protein [Pseudomonas sp. PDM13]